MLATASAQVCVPVGHSSLYLYTDSELSLRVYLLHMTRVMNKLA